MNPSRFFALLNHNKLSTAMLLLSIISLSLPAFATTIPGAFLGSTITVGDTNNTYAIADGNYIQGGLHSYDTLVQRNAITSERRHWGMLAVVTNDAGNNGTYQLTYNSVDTNINNNANWTLFTTGGGGGGSITLRTNGTNNGSQSILNLVEGNNITLTDNGSGSITIDASGGGGGGSQWDDVTGGIAYSAGRVGIGSSTLQSATALTIDPQSNEIGIFINPGASLLNGVRAENSDGTTVGVLGAFEDGIGVSGSGTFAGVSGFNDAVDGAGVYASQNNSAGYGIYSNAAQNYFSGNVGIAKTNPTRLLDILTPGGEGEESMVVQISTDTSLLQDPISTAFKIKDYLGQDILQLTGVRGDDEVSARFSSPNGEMEITALEGIRLNSENSEITIGGSLNNQTLALTGTFRYVDGNEQINSILTSDANGNASWSLAPITIQNGNSLFSTGLTGAGVDSDATNALFLGEDAGNGATNATFSNFIGYQAGLGSEFASHANFFGYGAGSGAVGAAGSNFFGENAGFGAINASGSNFFGGSTGIDAINASQSNFIGSGAGTGATNASQANFFGHNAGSGATNASHSIFFGENAGLNDLVDNTGSSNNYSILLGQETSTGGFSNSIALGAFAVNSAANQLVIGSATQSISSIFIGGNNGTASTN